MRSPDARKARAGPCRAEDALSVTALPGAAAFTFSPTQMELTSAETPRQTHDPARQTHDPARSEQLLLLSLVPLATTEVDNFALDFLGFLPVKDLRE